MTMAKATTNGVIPMGVVAVRDGIYDAITDASSGPEGSSELFHGYTYSGIPVAVAAALAVQDIFDKDDIFKRAKDLTTLLLPYKPTGFPARYGGRLSSVIDIKMKDKPGKAGFQTFKHCYDAGVNFKSTGDTLIIAPQFICEKKHIDEIIEKLRTGISNYAKS